MADKRTQSPAGNGTLETTAPDKGKASEHGLRLGTVVGRYVILDPLGSGGMGVVFAAYDPELNRRIAIKLLKPEIGRDLSARRLRLLHEAQALAQLSHPNVIAVYDVGTFGDQVFLAMELVDGPTLRQWLGAETRSWRSIVRVFQQAGEALASAHAAGVVHRDFKPENVIVGNDGRVRVVDFGIALTEGVDVRSPDLVRIGEGSLETLATRTGVLVGTPAYMSPEQKTGRGSDARSDEFSFCVSLYEALFGQRPPDDLASERTENHKLPKRLRALLHRGLRPNADERFAAMPDLLAELGRCAPAAGRKSWHAGAALMTCALAISTYLGLRHRGAAMCGGANQKLAGAWDPARANTIHAAFAATGKPYAEQTFSSVQHQLDGWAQRWTQMHTEACEATRVRGEQSEQLLDLRMECLDRRLRELKATTDLFASADTQVVANAVQAAGSLPELDPCADAKSLQATVKPPADPNLRARVDELRARLAPIKALYFAGKYREGLQLAAPAAKDAESIHYRPVEAEAFQVLGFLQSATADWHHAEETIRRAITAAEAGGHVDVEIQAWTQLAWILSNQDDRLADAENAHEHAAAIIERVGGHQRQTSLGLNALCTVYWKQRRFDDMIRCQTQVLELDQKGPVVDYENIGAAYNNFGVAYEAKGELEPALDYYHRALPILERSLGSQHPKVGGVLTNIGVALEKQGRYAESQGYEERALAIFEASLSPTAPQVALVLSDLADVVAARGDYETALHHYERALTIARKAPTPSLLAMVQCGIGDAQVRLGHPQKAIAPLEEALAKPLHSAASVSIVRQARFDLAWALWDTGGDRRRARQLASEALTATPADATDALSTKLRGEILAWQKKHR
jgi:tetratricopeptide (TPR) repeat protein/tRNA A-37 threonylcarbamoyl transferase component Bud32